MTTVNVKKDLIGAEDLNLGLGEFDRETSTGGNQVLSKINTGTFLPGVFHVDQLDAVGDGVEDDYAPIQAAIQLAQVSGGGTVVLADKTYGIGQLLRLPDHVGLVGLGDASVLKAIGGMSAVLVVDETSLRGNRGAPVSNFKIDGNRLANTGLYLERSVQREFHSLTITGCTECGVDIVESQNNRFVGVDTDRNGGAVQYGCGIRLNRGSGNNLFERCEVELNDPYQLIIRDDGGGATGFWCMSRRCRPPASSCRPVRSTPPPNTARGR
jgi:hypothetical protein